MEKDEYLIKYGNRASLIDEMKAAGVVCCIEPAIDVDSNQLLLNLRSHTKINSPVLLDEAVTSPNTPWKNDKVILQ